MILSKESSYSNVKINSGENTAVLNLCTIHNSDFNLRRNILISRKNCKSTLIAFLNQEEACRLAMFLPPLHIAEVSI